MNLIDVYWMRRPIIGKLIGNYMRPNYAQGRLSGVARAASARVVFGPAGSAKGLALGHTRHHSGLAKRHTLGAFDEEDWGNSNCDAKVTAGALWEDSVLTVATR